MSSIRIMKKSDLNAIDEIFNQAIEAKFSTAFTSPLSGEERLSWFHDHDPADFPVFVLEEKGVVAGFVFFSPYRKGRKALQSTAEISYFVHSGFHLRGIGSRLMEHAISKAPEYMFKTLIAIIMEPNIASIALLNKFKFRLWGEMPGILEVEGGNYNHQYYGLHV
ncbi:MAG TPA: N-acetyltransferase family protein [Bacteroides sp.]|nr:N-acetyltransferase family protein [Bacteroides sp.]